MDLTKDRAKLKELYMPGTKDFDLVDVPELPFAMIDGHGPPEHDTAARLTKCLFTAIQPIRRQARARMGKAFVEAPLEMLYWAQDMRDLATGNKEMWSWRAMITLPVWTDQTIFSNAVVEARRQLGVVPDTLRMEHFEEGRCVQIMHAGLAQDIPSLLERLYTRFLPENNLVPAGAYHEIYLDDWSRTAPERRKMVLRQPVRPKT